MVTFAHYCLAAAGAIALAAAGCRGRATEAPAAGARVVRVVDEKQFQSVLEQNRGKVVLVDFWATWCEPCRELFPHTVQWQRRYRDQGLAVLAVSLDELEDQGSVARFLSSQGADFPCFISQYGTNMRSFEAFEVGDGAIPFLRLYDRQGKVYKTFVGGDEQGIEAAVKELLAQKAA